MDLSLKAKYLHELQKANRTYIENEELLADLASVLESVDYYNYFRQIRLKEVGIYIDDEARRSLIRKVVALKQSLEAEQEKLKTKADKLVKKLKQYENA